MNRTYFRNEGLFSNHFLQDRLPESSEWEVDRDEVEEAFAELKAIYEREEATLAKRSSDEEGLRDRFISPILSEVLSFEYEKEKSIDGSLTPDYALYADVDTRNDAVQSEAFYDSALSLFEAKAWQRDLERYTKGGAQDVGKNPLFQLYRYLVNTEQEWGVLSNGEEWRLLHQEASSKLDSYYSVNIVDIIEEDDVEAFKWFYLFFRKEAFTGENSFLDELREESVTYATAVGEDLEDNVYRALEWLAKGYTENQSNYDNGDRQLQEYDLDEIQENCLIFLYRLLFAFYADSRGMLGDPPETYEEYSFRAFVDDVVSNYDKYKDRRGGLLGDKLSRIFRLIDQGSEAEGIPSDVYHVPAYNGGLFSNDRHDFLATYNLYDKHLAKVVKLLATTDEGEGDGEQLVDYHDLSVRHLGGIYEGLLEYNIAKASENLVSEDGEWVPSEDVDDHFLDYDEEQRAAVGDIYLRTDSGERKATGSYYTPDYIVQYIVENTVGPRIDDKLDGLEGDEEKAEVILDLTVLDPAMGSGHFLVEATDYIASRLTNYAEVTPKEARRMVARRCIYGVDINPLATELAKVSLWLKTMDQDRPLSFLDHHLKAGNSLVGASLEELGSHPEEDTDAGDGGQQSLDYLFEDSEEIDIQQNIQQLLYFYQNIVDSAEDNPEDVYAQEEEYQKFKANKFRRRFDVLADVYTSYYFGNDYSEDDYQRLLEAFQPHNDNWDDITSEDWVRRATDSIPDTMESNLSDEQGFFHWELEFPEIFFDIENGQRDQGDGFDAVVGNPPYINTHDLDSPYRGYLSNSQRWKTYKGGVDIHYLFIELGVKLVQSRGYFSYITSRYWFNADHADRLRDMILEKMSLSKIVDFKSNHVFPGIGVHTCIFVASSDSEDLRVTLLDEEVDDVKGALEEAESFEYPFDISTEGWKFSDPRHAKITEKLREYPRLESIAKASKGMGTGANDVFIVDKATVNEYRLEEELLKNLVRNGDIGKYTVNEYKTLLYTENIQDINEYPNTREYLLENREKLDKRNEKDNDGDWWELGNPRNSRLLESNENKIFCPYRATENKFALDTEQGYSLTDTTFIVLKDSTNKTYFDLLPLLNSLLLTYFYSQTGKEKGQVLEFFAKPISRLPIPEQSIDDLSELGERRYNLTRRLEKYDGILLHDYLGTYEDGNLLDDVYLPANNVSSSLIADTTEERDNLRVSDVQFEKNNRELLLSVKARYKPRNESERKTDRWGYTESDFIPTMRFDVDEKMEDLIREFVPVAVKEADGFAGFRENATKTKSILNRLENLTLPKREDVETGLDKYLENKEKTEKLKAEIQETDEKIDAIVFDLYDLNEDEVHTVLDSLDIPEDEQNGISEKFRDL